MLNRTDARSQFASLTAQAVERLRQRAQLLRERHERANRLDPEAVRFFSRHYRPAAIGLVGTDDAIGRAIREAQKDITGDGKPSLWSHCSCWVRSAPTAAVRTAH